MKRWVKAEKEEKRGGKGGGLCKGLRGEERRGEGTNLTLMFRKTWLDAGRGQIGRTMKVNGERVGRKREGFE